MSDPSCNSLSQNKSDKTSNAGFFEKVSNDARWQLANVSRRKITSLKWYPLRSDIDFVPCVKKVTFRTTWTIRKKTDGLRSVLNQRIRANRFTLTTKHVLNVGPISSNYTYTTDNQPSFLCQGNNNVVSEERTWQGNEEVPPLLAESNRYSLVKWIQNTTHGTWKMEIRRQT